MNFQNNYQYPNFSIVNNNKDYTNNKGRYIGLNRIINKNSQNFFFQPNQKNVLQSYEYRGMPNNAHISYQNNLNKSSDINNMRTINTSQIRQTIQKLNNDIKKLNGIVHLRNNNLTKKKNNSYLMQNNASSNMNSNYMNYLRNNPNQNDLINYRKMNQTYKINNNINKNYYITYDLKKMKFNINNNNLNADNNYSDNEVFQRKFSQSTHTNKNNYKNYPFSNKSVLNNKNNNFDIGNFDDNQFYKSSSIYKGIKNNNNYGTNIKNFSINENSNEDEGNNILNYNMLKNNLLPKNNTNNILKQTGKNQQKKYNNAFSINNSQNSKVKSNIYGQKNNSNNFKYHTNVKEFDGNDSDNLSDLADEFIEAFNIDIVKDENIQDNLQTNKTSNIYHNNSYTRENNFSQSDLPQFKSKSKEINMNQKINMNTNNNIIKTPSRIVEKNISITNSNNNYPKKIAENPKEIEPLKESVQIEEESLIHDSQLDIPLIKETLIYNKVIKDNKLNQDNLFQKNEDNQKSIPLNLEGIINIQQNDKNQLNLDNKINIQNDEKLDIGNINSEISNKLLNKDEKKEISDKNENANVKK